MEQEEQARIGALAGIFGAMTFYVLLALAIWSSGDWRFGYDFLSDLGASGPYGWLFNSAVVILGALGIAFTWFLYPFVSWSRLGKTATITFDLGCVFLMLVGIFPIDTGDLHDKVSWAFFILIVLSLMLMMVPFRDHRTLGRPGFIATLAVVLLTIIDLLMVYSGLMRYELCEALVVLCLTTWVMVISVFILYKLRTDSFIVNTGND
ncbi:MAG: DUF998 domain-containing protein [Methanomassiliicoccales archaeon]|nr:DUF998 domain-containing protein [Methanomassiliicoccales archaeon]